MVLEPALTSGNLQYLYVSPVGKHINVPILCMHTNSHGTRACFNFGVVLSGNNTTLMFGLTDKTKMKSTCMTLGVSRD